MSKANYGKYVELMGDRALDESVWRKLKYISFTDMGIASFDPDSLPDGIQVVNLNNNNLESLSIPQRISGLEILSVSNNRLQSIEFEGKFKKFRVLNVHDNMLKNITITGVLGDLSKMDLSKNPISELDIRGSNLSFIDVRETNIMPPPSISRGVVLS